MIIIIVGIMINSTLAITVVRLVVQDNDVLEAHQFGHHALEQLPFGFESLEIRATAFE